MAIKPIDHYAIEHGPHHSIYDEEAMTALQLAGRTAAKMNETVRGFNELEESVPGLIADDVNKHIKDGDFDNQIGKHLDNLNERVDNLLSEVVPGGTTRDAEIVDIRVAEGGKTYDNAGNSVRGQVKTAAGASKATVLFSGGAAATFEGYDAETGETRIRLPGTKMHIFNPVTGSRNALTSDDILAQLPAYATAAPDGNGVIVKIPPYQGYMGVSLGEEGPQIFLSYGENDKKYTVPVNVLPLLYFYYGEVEGPLMWGGMNKRLRKYATQAYVDPIDSKVNTVEDVSRGSLYLSAPGTVEFSETSNGGLKVLIDGFPRMRFASHSTKINDWALLLPDGDDFNYFDFGPTQEIEIFLSRYDYILVYNVGDQKMHIRSGPVNLETDDFILVQNGYGEPIAGALLDIKTRMDAAEGVSNFALDASVCARFMEHYNRLEHKSAFIFFTDPHLCSGEGWAENLDKWVDNILRYAACLPIHVLVCGGDWLGNGDTPSEAIFKARYAMSKLNDRYIFNSATYSTLERVNIIGNHDTNEQGKATPDSENWTGKLPFDDLAVWDSAFNNTYSGEISMGNNKLVILHSMGETSGEEETEPAIARLKQILSDSKETVYKSDNIYIATHLFYSDDELTISPFGQKVLDLCTRFNTRNTGDGRVMGIFCGHRHKDAENIEGDIPVIMTTNFQSGGVPTFDIVLIDDDNGAIHTYRVGSGKDRTIYVP